MTDSRPTDDAVRVVRGVSGTWWLVLKVAAVLTILWGGIEFVVDRALDRREQVAAKIGRPEFTKYKERIELQIKELDRELGRLDDEIDELKR